MFFLKYLPFLLQMFSIAVYSNGIFELDDSEKHILSANKYEIYVDTTNTYSLENIEEQEFHLFEQNALHIENPDATYWVKFTIIPQQQQRTLILESVDPRLNFIQVYTKENGQYTSLAPPSGLDFSFNDKAFQHKNFLFELPSHSPQIDVLVQTKSKLHGLLLFKLETIPSSFAYALAEYFWLAIFYGALLALALYNLMIYLRLRAISYLYFFLYIIASMLMAFGEDGLGFHFIWSDATYFNKLVMGLSPIFYLITFILFGTSYLNIKEEYPKAYNLLLLVTFFSVLYGFYHWLFATNRSFLPISYIFSFIFLYGIVVQKLRDNYTNVTRNFLIAYSFVMLALVIHLMRHAALFDLDWNSVLLVYAMNIACFVEILLLSYAQTDKFRVAQLKKEQEIKKSEEKYRKISNELAEKNTKLEQYIASNNELQSFAYSVSHDLKQPIRTVSSFTKLLKQRIKSIENTPPEIQEFIQFIEQGSENMGNLVSDLLEYSTTNDANKKQFTLVDITEVLALVKNNLQDQIISNNVLIEEINVNVQVMGIRVKIIQLFQNLISNAIKFKAKDRRPVIVIKASTLANQIIFTLEDNGKGIHSDDLDKIFKVFYKNYEDVDDNVTGSGIGLSLCKKIALIHEGDITVESVYQKGTTFSITLPAIVERESEVESYTI